MHFVQVHPNYTKQSTRLKHILLDCLTTAQNNIEKKSTFILAEVLITLGIIGVIAALTLPGLLADLKNGCKDSQPEYCTAWIQMNGWKIPDDYQYKVSYQTII